MRNSKGDNARKAPDEAVGETLDGESSPNGRSYCTGVLAARLRKNEI
jgi:hypothetical protein